MKKIITVTIFFITFSAFVLGQVIFDYFDSVADQSSKEQQEKVFYNNQFKKFSRAKREVIAPANFYPFEVKTKEEFNFEKLKDKVVIINFWASWCRPCLQELPSMVKLRNRIKSQNFEIVTINTDETDQKKLISQISKKFKINFSIIPDSKGALTEMFNVSAIPATFIFVKSDLYLAKKGEMDFFSEELIELINKNISR